MDFVDTYTEWYNELINMDVEGILLPYRLAYLEYFNAGISPAQVLEYIKQGGE